MPVEVVLQVHVMVRIRTVMMLLEGLANDDRVLEGVECEAIIPMA